IHKVTRRIARPFTQHTTGMRNEVTPVGLSGRNTPGAGVNHTPGGGRIAQEANASGKTRGYADVGTVTRKVGSRSRSTQTMNTDLNPMYRWETLPWRQIERDVFKL